jgi:hypothetical protein
MRWRGWRWVAVSGLVLTFAPPSAADPTAEDRARRATLVRTGTAAAGSKDWQGCIDALTAALAIEKDARLAGQLGLCDENAGRFVEAYDHLMPAIESMTPEMTARQPWASYQAALRRVMDRVALLIVTADPPDTYVLVDGRPFGKADGRMFAVLPGNHVVTARHAGYQDVSDPRTFRGGDVPSFHFQMVPLPASAATAAEPSAPPAKTTAPLASGSPVAPARPSWWAPLVPSRGAALGPLLAYSSAIMSLAGVGLTIGLEVDRGSMARGHAATTCTAGNAASPFCAELHDRREQRNGAASIAIGFGAVAIGTGLAVVLAGMFRAPAAGAVVPVVGKDGGGLAIQGAW